MRYTERPCVQRLLRSLNLFYSRPDPSARFAQLSKAMGPEAVVTELLPLFVRLLKVRI